MKIMNLEDVYKFHPFYNDFKEQNFDVYLCQTFMRMEDDAKLEIRFSSGTNLTPETLKDGYFINKDTLLRNGEEFKVTDAIVVNLSYIGIDNDNYKKQGRGSKLLDWFVDLCDKYNYKIELDMDTKFKTPIDVLERFYGKRDFIRISDSKMIRPCKTDREKEFDTDSIKSHLYLTENYKILIDKVKSSILDYDDEDNIEYNKKIEHYMYTLERDITNSLNIIYTLDTINYVDLLRLFEAILTIIEFTDVEYGFESLSDNIDNLTHFINILKQFE